jgi:SAM-dependent methyltransferase
MPSNPKSMLRKVLPTAHRVLLEKIIQKKLSNVRGKVLVIGAGHDPYRNMLSSASSVIVTDISDNYGTIDVVVDAHQLPYKDGSFDTIIAIEVIEHLHTPSKAINECYRVLSENGTLVCSIPFMFHVHGDPNDYQRLTKQGIVKLTVDFKEVNIHEIGGRLAVALDIITTSSKIMVPFRIINNIFRLSLLSKLKINDCASGYWIEAKK